MEKELRVLELYSGIGGMHYALTASKINAKVVAAVDINPHANIVYRHNFKDTPSLQKTIEGIKIEEYNKLDFDMLLMSPPCQPFTRQGKQSGALDNRAQSFLYLTELLPQLRKKPKYILMENVKGFDESTAHDNFVAMLKTQNYSMKEFLLSPIQFGIPNSRLRYFLIAKLNDTASGEEYKSEIAHVIPESAFDSIEAIYNELRGSKAEHDFVSLDSINENPVASTKEGIVKEAQINNNYESCCQSEVSFMFQKSVKKLDEFIYPHLNDSDELALKDDAFDKNLQSADLVTKDATRTSCFTKNYGRYMEGTGSILIKSQEQVQFNVNPEATASNSDDKCKYVKVKKDNLRFLSPKEVANLHCFPTAFEYPNELTTIQKWKVIGNSLNVLIVSVLIKLMISMD